VYYSASTDTAYFVFGERFDVFDSNNKAHQEFVKTALEFFRAMNTAVNKPFAVFKYFPWMYNEFARATGKMRHLGEITHIKHTVL